MGHPPPKEGKGWVVVPQRPGQRSIDLRSAELAEERRTGSAALARRRAYRPEFKVDWEAAEPRAVETHVEGVVSFCGACTCDWGSSAASGCECECHAGARVHRDWAVVGQWIHPQWGSIARAVWAPFRWLADQAVLVAAIVTALLWTAGFTGTITPKVYLVAQVGALICCSVTNMIRKAGDG